jgi:FKBP-type peptidyl-prolyl cis-trans isomerase
MRINPAFLFAALAIAAAGCNPSNTPSDSGGGTTGSGKSGSHFTKLIIEDTEVGKGDPVEEGDEVWVRYTGKLTNGTVFDSNQKPGKDSFHVDVGSGQVIKGWDQGLVGMKVGGHRKLSIPAVLAYGSQDKPPIPPNSDLVFDITLSELLKKNDKTTINATNIKAGTGREVKKGDTVTIDYDATKGTEEIEAKSNVTFKIGAGDMQIPGFDDALIGMKVGGVREIKIPPALTRMLITQKIGMFVSTWKVTLKAIN